MRPRQAIALLADATPCGRSSSQVRKRGDVENDFTSIRHIGL